MAYSSAHAAKSGSVPFMLRGPKSLRTVLAAAVAGAIGLTPTLLFASPAAAVSTVLHISAVQAAEGSDVVFSLIYDGPGAATYNISSAGVTATSGTDFTAVTGGTQVVFTGADTKQVTVHTTPDSTYEANETFTITATNSGTPSDTVDATGTILDNDNAPSYTLTATPSTVSESSSPTVQIRADLAVASGVDTTITLNSSDGTAKATTNYDQVVDETILIEAGDTTGTATVPVGINDDLIKDATDTMSFTVNGLADNASPRAASATVNITDAQSTPQLTLSVAGSPATEGSALTYTVTAAPGSAVPITVKWDAVTTTPATGHSAATPVDDFVYPTDRTVTIPVGSLSKTFTITPINDGVNENPEDFAVQLSAPTNATLSTTSKVNSVITDANSSAAPTVAITPTSVAEGNAGRSTKTFTATLNQKSGRTVTVDWSTYDQDDEDDNPGFATSNVDFVRKFGTLTFPAGTLTQTFTVEIIGDTVDEGNGETFGIYLSSEDGSASLGMGNHVTVPITITDDDSAPTMTLADLSLKEGESTSALLLPLTLSNASDHDLVYNLSDDTSTLPASTRASGTMSSIVGSGDYTLLTAGPVTIPAGKTSGYIVVLDNGDAIFEGDESASFTVTPTSGSVPYVTTGAKTAKLTLLNDDKAPVLAIDNVTGKEGETVTITGTYTGASQNGLNATVSYAGGSVKGSKAADANDFTNPGVVSADVYPDVPSGSTVTIGQLVLTADTTAEPAETIIVSGTGLNNSGTVTPGSVTIAATDGSTPPVAGAPTIVAPEKVTGSVPVSVTGVAAAGATVELWGAPMAATKAPLTKLLTTTANATTGAYSFSRLISTGYRFQTAVGTLMSVEKSVSVVQSPLFIVSSPSAGTVSLAVQGNPRGPGQSVIIQRWVNGAWVNTTWRGTTGSDNLWKATAKVPAKSSWTLRAFVAGYTPTGLLPGYSSQKAITIK